MTARKLGFDDRTNFEEEFPGLEETGSYTQHVSIMGRS